MERKYIKELDEEDDIYSVEEWAQAVKDGWFCKYDGDGYWVKNWLRSDDEVFSTSALDATHVVWYNK